MADPRELLKQYVRASYVDTDPASSPWPNDPDAGEMRIINALRAVLDLHTPVRLAGSPDECRACMCSPPCPTARAITRELEKP